MSPVGTIPGLRPPPAFPCLDSPAGSTGAAAANPQGLGRTRELQSPWPAVAELVGLSGTAVLGSGCFPPRFSTCPASLKSTVRAEAFSIPAQRQLGIFQPAAPASLVPSSVGSSLVWKRGSTERTGPLPRTCSHEGCAQLHLPNAPRAPAPAPSHRMSSWMSKERLRGLPGRSVGCCRAPGVAGPELHPARTRLCLQGSPTRAWGQNLKALGRTRRSLSPAPCPTSPLQAGAAFLTLQLSPPTGAKTVAPRARSSPPRAARSREVPGRAGASTERWPLSREEEGSWHISLCLCQGSCSPAGTGLLSSRGNPPAVRGAGDGAGAGASALCCWGPSWGVLGGSEHRPLRPQTHRIIKAVNYQSPEPCLPPFPGLLCSCPASSVAAGCISGACSGTSGAAPQHNQDGDV